MRRARTYRWTRMRPYRARFREQGVFFAFQSWAGCITNIFGFDLRQAQVTEQHVAVGRHVIEAAIVLVGRGLPRRVNAQYLFGDEQRVKAVGDEVDAHRGDDEPCRVDALAPAESYDPERKRTERDHCSPEQF